MCSNYPQDNDILLGSLLVPMLRRGNANALIYRYPVIREGYQRIICFAYLRTQTKLILIINRIKTISPKFVVVFTVVGSGLPRTSNAISLT